MKQLFRCLAAGVIALPLTLSAFTAKAQEIDIVETAVSAGSFETLVKAVQAAGLVDTLKGEGPFTVFAPTDAAFAKLPEGKLDSLLKPENKDELVELLSYHVVSEKLTAADIAGKKITYKTLSGEEVQINAAGRVAKINHAAIQQPDVMASNGVIHVIDKVITPN
ncbi:MAG: fasciclin domain-containing protein [Alphaproteobacteria bacterium]|nr:fasciclin domain-containing protein [Alphaproteobacteria bacterium]